MNSFHGDVATMLQQMWQAIGVEVTFDAVESGVYYSQIDEGNIEIGRYGLQTGDSPLTMLKNWTDSNLVTPLLGDEKYNKMIDDAQKLADPTEFAKALHEAEDYLVQEQCYEFPLFQFSSPALVQSNLKNYEQHSTTLYFSGCSKG
jgi:oligopeptide transport system substrate-binding protein